eukprot:CAMPEP_0172322034 /NCGR_PEP_ID=MMETSP1058-20130122/44835_1 /TAXON_ID=83371 /ORGANISM="Detonula confervacea, Strain CCMP 353" /LENGTH=376 /DNA_ID=CAMNT_0013037669 /DNA_START=21 /DNA_END=1151 /DNA_ORIENTATION=-
MLNIRKSKIRAAQCTDYGDNVEVLSVQDDIVATPRIEDKAPAGFQNVMLIRVLAVALAPGDIRVMSGKTREFQGPPSFPYVPGGDVCGVVVEVPEDDKNGRKCRFRVGDKIAARFANKPMGMLGEYALVNTDVCDCVPEGTSAEGAAALVSSGTVAVLIADRIQEGDRVLIFGAGGGVGSHLCQMVRLQGASYVAGVGRDPQRLMEEPLGCDFAIDYTKTNPFLVKEWRDNPFDVIVDLSGGAWPELVNHRSSQSIVKSTSKKGRYLTTTPDKPTFELHSVWAMMKTFLFPALWRVLYTRCGMSRFSLPKYSYVLALPSTTDIVTRTLTLSSENKLVPSIDAQGPFPFTTDGVRDAFRLQASRHAKGKVVITVAKE